MTNKPLTSSERSHYEETITKLSGASSLQKGLIWFIVLVVLLALGLQIKSSNDAVKRANAASEKRTQIVQTVQRTTDEQNKLIESQLATVNRHIDCVISFFTVTDRANLTIEDIDNCTLNKAGELLQPNTTAPGTVPLQSAPQSSTQGTSNPSSSTGTTPPASSGSSTSTPPAQTTPPVSVKVTPNCKVDILFIHLGC